MRRRGLPVWDFILFISGSAPETVRSKLGFRGIVAWYDHPQRGKGVSSGVVQGSALYKHAACA